MGAKTVEASFPSNIERVVASALLQLSLCCSNERSDNSCSPESFESSGFAASKTDGSSIAEVSVDEGSSPSQQLTVIAFEPEAEPEPESHDLDLKIVRKKRSKSICMPIAKKLKSKRTGATSAPVSSESVSEITTEASVSSCFSSSSSAQSYPGETNAADNMRKKVIPGHMWHKASAILRVLSKGSTSEVRIRQLLGDSPSTSKALRMLLRQQAVKRYGAGGRGDPFIYMMA